MTVVNKYPRKTNLRTAMLLFIIGWTIILISTNFVNLIVGSVLCGIAAG